MNDHRGITLVELIIAIAISTVILGAATLFLGMAHKNYNPDMNQESANMLALQTSQQLAVNSLSLASQASQAVLRLF